MFSEHIRELRVHKKLPQRVIASALEIDTATYCKIEKGERKAKEEYISVLSEIFEVSSESLLVLWLADQIVELMSKHRAIASSALNLVLQEEGYYRK
ncbi:helix-turn-helix domain-containing protein [Porphyromonas sp. COT-239 OH1446]|uniref:helix-turn-helix domain-containing protein n=1 Tax=Porphyromonas sp. COT-239 OH1446 TaxID=1515613 RepID=UPI00052D00AB|nr:helix-turn-helix transcriptional regulator [Porphyromonas sp. COT-239 OH1446]KGN68402.1 DNA-binding protein [Porphyromonas sp. COT-239 OH1446]